MGPRFSNALLQSILTYLKKIPEQEGHRIIIIGTTSEEKLMQDLGIWDCFNLKVEVPTLRSSFGEVQAAFEQILPEFKAVKDLNLGSDFNLPIKSLYFIANTLKQRIEEDPGNDLQSLFYEIYGQTQGIKSG